MEFEAHILMAHPDEGHRFEGGPRREKEWNPAARCRGYWRTLTTCPGAVTESTTA